MGRKKNEIGIGFLILLIAGGVVFAIKILQVVIPLIFKIIQTVVTFIFRIFTKEKLSGQVSFQSHESPYQVTGGKTSNMLNGNNVIRISKDGSSIRGKFKFYESHEEIQVGNLKIDAYLLYVGQSPDLAPHLIDPRLSIGRPISYTEADLGYWPSYAGIDQNQRASFLQWIAEGRSATPIDIGFVFIYLYGLEYRAIVEGQNHIEIFEEVLRLFQIYALKTDSFSKYCSSFLSWLILKNERISDEQKQTLKEHLNKNPVLKRYFDEIGLSHLRSGNVNDLILHAAANLRLTVPREASDSGVDFECALQAKLEKLFPTLPMPINMGKVVFTYMPSSQIIATSEIYIDEWKYDSAVDRQIRKAWLSIADECVAYKRMSRSMGSLAELYRPNTISENAQDLNTFLQFHDYKVIKLEELFEVMKYTELKTTPTYSKQLAEGLSRQDLSIEPDARLTNRAYKRSDSVVLIGKALEELKAERWQKIVLFFDLAASLESSDDQSSQDLTPVIDSVDKYFKLKPAEIERLKYRTHLIWVIDAPISATARKLASVLSVKQGDAISRFLFSSATRQGSLSKSKRKLLEMIFKAFNFSPNKLDELLAKYSGGENLTVIKKASTGGKEGSKIPKPSQEVVSNSGSTLFLDPVLLTQAMSETAEVSVLMASVFVEEDESEKESAHISSTAIEKPQLTKELQKILQVLSEKERWKIVEVESICKNDSLMYGAVLNAINLWSEAVYCEILLEEDEEELVVSKYLLDEVNSA